MGDTTERMNALLEAVALERVGQTALPSSLASRMHRALADEQLDPIQRDLLKKELLNYPSALRFFNQVVADPSLLGDDSTSKEKDVIDAQLPSPTESESMVPTTEQPSVEHAATMSTVVVENGFRESFENSQTSYSQKGTTMRINSVARPRFAWGITAAAAVILVVIGGSIYRGLFFTNGAGPNKRLALNIPDLKNEPLRNLAENSGIARSYIGHALPDWAKGGNDPGTLGGGADENAIKWALSTVVVSTPIHSAGGDGVLMGSGALLSEDGLILTNYHVVAYAAQQAALKGEAGKVSVIFPSYSADSGIAPFNKDRPALATIYRVNPSKDLALIKIDELPKDLAKLPFFKLASSPAKLLSDAYFVGSQGGGPAWQIRAGKVTAAFPFPEGLSEFLTDSKSFGMYIRAQHSQFISIQGPISGGDSGGPVIDEHGDLVALIDATPVNEAKGSLAFAIAQPELKNFLNELPKEPELIPPDIFLGGQYPPDADIAEQSYYRGTQDGTDIMGYGVAVPSDEDVGKQKLASLVIYLDMAATNKPSDEHQPPVGLWGWPQSTGFKFDVVMAISADRKQIMIGYAKDGVLNEIRVGSPTEDAAGLIWHRDKNGRWTVDMNPGQTPLLNGEATKAIKTLNDAQEHAVAKW